MGFGISAFSSEALEIVGSVKVLFGCAFFLTEQLCREKRSQERESNPPGVAYEAACNAGCVPAKVVWSGISPINDPTAVGCVAGLGKSLADGGEGTCGAD